VGERKRILFCSEHCLADGASGAAVSAVEMLSLLAKRDWEVSVLCGGKMDGKGAPPVGERVEVGAGLPANGSADGSANNLRDGSADSSGDNSADNSGENDVAVHHLDFRGVPTRVVRMAKSADGETADAAAARANVPLVLLLEREIARHRPDVLLMYGGGWCGRAVLKVAKRAGVPSVFWLRNTYYQREDLFSDVTGAIIVPSSFTSKYYRELLGLECEVLFSVVLRDRVYCPVRRPRYLTFVSPLPEKGAYFWARVMSELGRSRPDIEMLVVEGRGSASWLDRTGMTVLNLPSVTVMGRCDDPREFLAVTRILAFPSVWPETFGRTAVEAMVSGIPVVTSDRGGLPEVVGTGGVVLGIPARITHETVLLANVAEVKPWVEAICRLWDDEEEYRRLSREAAASAARFDPDVISDRIDVLLRQRSGRKVAGDTTSAAEMLVASGLEGDVQAELRRWDAVVAGAERLLA